MCLINNFFSNTLNTVCFAAERKSDKNINDIGQNFKPIVFSQAHHKYYQSEYYRNKMNNYEQNNTEIQNNINIQNNNSINNNKNNKKYERNN